MHSFIYEHKKTSLKPPFFIYECIQTHVNLSHGYFPIFPLFCSLKKEDMRLDKR